MVGQQFVSRLARHPWFDVTWLAASERSEGKAYEAAAPWRLAAPMPAGCRDLNVERLRARPRTESRVLRARRVGRRRRSRRPFAAAGHIVLSNARNFRMDPLVPLLIPEVNADHLCILMEQRAQKGWAGAIVTNPNCSTIVLAMALAPLRQFNIRAVDRLDDAGGVGRGISGRAVARHSWQRHSVHRRRRREDADRNAEDSRHRRRPLAVRRRGQRAYESRAGHRRPHDDGVGGSGRGAGGRGGHRGDADVSRPAAGIEAADRAEAGDCR